MLVCNDGNHSEQKQPISFCSVHGAKPSLVIVTTEWSSWLLTSRGGGTGGLQGL